MEYLQGVIKVDVGFQPVDFREEDVGAALGS